MNANDVDYTVVVLIHCLFKNDKYYQNSQLQ